ncbi:hypothetical protein ABID95_001241 [Streptomyces atratus]
MSGLSASQWSNVQAIRIERFQGAQIVVIYEAGGRRTRLRAPITGFLCWDRGFEEKFDTIGRWWLDHRGPDWAPVLLPGAQLSGPPLPDGNPFGSPTYSAPGPRSGGMAVADRSG